METELEPEVNEVPEAEEASAFQQNYWLHGLLFLLTLVTTTLAGAELATGGHWFTWDSDAALQLTAAHWALGLPYMLGFMLFITCHEFGHYFTARYHGVRASLPYYLPVFVPLSGVLNVGSLGAIIRLRDRPLTTGQYFDIGIAGPLAGFVVALALLVIGLLTLPEAPPHLLPQPQAATEQTVLAPRLGNSLLFWLLEHTLADPTRLPNHLDLFHYPLLFAGFLGLFFTSLNLLPIGQLDGGHVVYGLFGQKIAGKVARITVLALLMYGGLGMLDLADPTLGIAPALYLLFLVFTVSRLLGTRRWVTNALVVLAILAAQQVLQQALRIPGENYLWLFYAFMAVQVLKVDHPRARMEHRLSLRQRVLGFVALGIFVLCFVPHPVYLVELHLPPALLTLWN